MRSAIPYHRTAYFLSLAVLIGCGGTDTTEPVVSAPTEVVLVTANVVDWQGGDKITAIVKNTGGKGSYYLEFWGYPVPTSPSGCYVGQPCPQPAQRKMSSTNTTSISLNYEEQLIYQVAPIIQSVRAFSQSFNSAVIRQTACVIVREGGSCP